MSKKNIRLSALMRCCVTTIREFEHSEEEGTVISCRWCSNELRLRDDAWEWASDLVSRKRNRVTQH